MLLLLKFVHPLFVHYQCALSTYDYGFIIGQNISKILGKLHFTSPLPKFTPYLHFNL